MRRTWVYNPHVGGRNIPPHVQEKTRSRIIAYAEKHYTGKYTMLDVRFRGNFCYIDAYHEPCVPKKFNSKLYGESLEQHVKRLRNTPIHLCRLRYLGSDDRWSMAFYTYSNEQYTPSVFNNGTFEGTPEEGFETSAGYLRG